MPARQSCRRRVFSGRAIAPLGSSHGVLDVSSPSSTWPIDPASGQAAYTQRIAFSEPYPVPPRVVAGLAAIELGEGPAARLEVRVVPGSITATGFTLRFSTAPGGQVASAGAFWLALPF